MGAQSWSWFPFAYSVSLWVCPLDIRPDTCCWLTPNRKSTPGKLLDGPALSHGRVGGKEQVIRGR